MRARRAIRSLSKRSAAAVIMIAMVVLPALPASGRGGRDVPGVEVLGVLEDPSGDEHRSGWAVEIDEKRRLLYYVWKRGTDIFLTEYDLRVEVPKLLRNTYLGSYDQLGIDSGSPYTMQIDLKKRFLILLGGAGINVVDLKSFKMVGEWDMTGILPGFQGQGLTYSRADDRIYVLGSMSQNSYVTRNEVVARPAQVSAVVALDVSDFSAGPQLAWFRPVPECQQPADTVGTRALIARSHREDALYFACIRPDPYPGESGVVRLWFDPKATPQDAAEFQVDFFPISGSYTSVNSGTVGIAAFDYKTDRFFLQSIAAATPGAWVLDGRLSAWIGFIAAPDATNEYLGFNSDTGHYYLGGSDLTPARKGGYIQVADARSTPITQGRVYTGLGVGGFILVDSQSNRLFARMNLKRFGHSKDPLHMGYMVLRDNLPSEVPPPPPDFDALTKDIEEGPDTITTYSGGINGFGARVVLIGGYGGLTGGTVRLPQLRSGDRGLTAARVPLIDLRNIGATAAAQPLVADSNTHADLYDLGLEEWPWVQTSCFDGGGDGGEQVSSGPAGEAKVVCDLAKEEVSATSNFGRIAGAGVEIGSSSFTATSKRSENSGIVTHAEATVKGLELSSPGGSVSIGKITSIAVASAHGRPGTAKAKWQRILSGIEIRDANGERVQAAAECVSSPKEDDCERVIAQANRVLQQRMRLDLPAPDIDRTSGGAYAGIHQSDADFNHARTVYNQGTSFSAEASSRALPGLSIIVFNDSVEKSRALFQLAAVQADSVYTISPNLETEPPPPDIDTVAGGMGGGAGRMVGGIRSGSPSLGPSASLGDMGAVAAPIDTVAETAPAAVQAIRAFLTLPVIEALSMAGVWMLFLASGAGIYKRRALMLILRGVTR